MRLVKAEDISATGRAKRISELVAEAEAKEDCPKCGGSQFVAFMTTDFVVSDAVWDDMADRWRVSGTSLGNLELKSMQCVNCGWKAEHGEHKEKEIAEEEGNEPGPARDVGGVNRPRKIEIR